MKLAKVKGEFVWHHHEAKDKLFLVVKDRLVIKLRDRDVVLEAGEFFIGGIAQSLSRFLSKTPLPYTIPPTYLQP